jgi:hypothetical protein
MHFTFNGITFVSPVLTFSESIGKQKTQSSYGIVKQPRFNPPAACATYNEQITGSDKIEVTLVPKVLSYFVQQLPTSCRCQEFRR